MSIIKTRSGFLIMLITHTKRLYDVITNQKWLGSKLAKPEIQAGNLAIGCTQVLTQFCVSIRWCGHISHLLKNWPASFWTCLALALICFTSTNCYQDHPFVFKVSWPTWFSLSLNRFFICYLGTLSIFFRWHKNNCLSHSKLGSKLPE